MSVRLGLAAAAVAFAAVGCGHARAREISARLAVPPGCHVDVFFASSVVSGRAATAAEIAAVRKTIASSSKVRTYAFVSKRLALRRMAQRHPAMVRRLPVNPFPPSYELVPRSSRDAGALKAELRTAPGVEHVGVAKAC